MPASNVLGGGEEGVKVTLKAFLGEVCKPETGVVIWHDLFMCHLKPELLHTSKTLPSGS